jgi:hypothetical protein
MFHVEHSAMTALERALKLSPTAAAKALERHGRGKDSILAHINPREAELLKALGGSGKRNPKTGLLEFQDDESSIYQPSPIFGGGSGDSGGGGGGFLSGLFGGGGGDTSTAASDTSTSAPTTSVSAPQQLADASGGGTDFGGPGQFNFGYGGTSGGQPAAAPAQTAAAPAAAPDALGGGLALGTPTAGGTGANPMQSILGGPDAALGGAGTDQATKPGTKAPPSYGDKLLSSLGGLVAPDNLTKLLGAAIPAGIGLLNNRQAGKQQAAQAQQITNIGAPYSTLGQQDITAATQGALTPQSAQSYQIMQARLAQDAAQRGGVGAQQNIALLENQRQNLLAQQLQTGITLAQVGDKYTMAGIQQTIQNDANLNTSTSNFLTAMARAMGGVAPQTAGGANAPAR